MLHRPFEREQEPRVVGGGLLGEPHARGAAPFAHDEEVTSLDHVAGDAQVVVRCDDEAVALHPPPRRGAAERDPAFGTPLLPVHHRSLAYTPRCASATAQTSSIEAEPGRLLRGRRQICNQNEQDGNQYFVSVQKVLEHRGAVLGKRRFGRRKRHPTVDPHAIPCARGGWRSGSPPRSGGDGHAAPVPWPCDRTLGHRGAHARTPRSTRSDAVEPRAVRPAGAGAPRRARRRDCARGRARRRRA